MIRLIAFSLIFTIAQSCGVKAPPVAPVRDPIPVPQVLDCSPYDESCDATDPDYRPGKP